MQMQEVTKVAKPSYPAVIERGEFGFGVWFPDIDGCVSAGDTVEQAIANAGEALNFWFEDAKEIPRSSSLEDAKSKARKQGTVVLVSVAPGMMRPV